MLKPHYRTALVILSSVVLTLVLFNLFSTPASRPDSVVPLLQRQGQWPHQHLMSLTTEQRLQVLHRAIVSAGHDCDARSAEFKGLRDDLDHPAAFHLVDCADASRFLVALMADPAGTTHILDCTHALEHGWDCARDWSRLPPFPKE